MDGCHPTDASVRKFESCAECILEGGCGSVEEVGEQLAAFAEDAAQDSGDREDELPVRHVVADAGGDPAAGATRDSANAIADEVQQHLEKSSQGARGPFWCKRLRVPILLAFLIAFFNQLSGINAILYFSPRIFQMTGLGENAALLQSAGIGVTNLVFTFVGLWLIDRMGRRRLLYIGSFGYILSLGLVSWAFYTGNFAIVPVCIFAFIAAHAVGQGELARENWTGC